MNIDSQHETIATRKCATKRCRKRVPVRTSSGRNATYCWPCMVKRRREANRQCATRIRSLLSSRADVRAPLFKITGGQFQHSTVAQIIRNWEAWQRDHEREMV